MLVTLGVCADGRRVVLDMRLAGVESEQAWLDAVRALCARDLGAPLLAVIDGNPGLAAALKMQWPKLAIQRCTNRKLWNLLAKAPAHLREELAEDYRRMIYADSRQAVEQPDRVHAQVETALAGGQCKFCQGRRRALTFDGFPSSQWKALRTTNALERINEEFRRRTKNPRPHCRARRRSCSCSLVYCAAARSRCAAWSAGKPWPIVSCKPEAASRLHNQSLARRMLTLNAFPPLDRHYLRRLDQDLRAVRRPTLRPGDVDRS